MEKVFLPEEFRSLLLSNGESLRYFGDSHHDIITDQIKWMNWRDEKLHGEFS